MFLYVIYAFNLYFYIVSFSIFDIYKIFYYYYTKKSTILNKIFLQILHILLYRSLGKAQL